jgi:tetratricopeptide (TPR) repeat protein
MTLFSKHHTAVSLFLISITVWVVYFNSLQVPFYFDDIRSISNNQILQTGSFLDIAKAHGMRAISYLSFALDYKISGDISQFHISNILVHMLNGFLVFGLFHLLLFKTPNSVKSLTNKDGTHLPINDNNTSTNNVPSNLIKCIPLFGALLFIVHPLNSQAVTYIVQRSASLAALFYLAALCSYVLMRLQPKIVIKVVAFIGFVACFSFGILTKQNTVTLPLMIIALELILFNHLKLKHLAILFSITLISLGITYLVNSEWLINIAMMLDTKTRENDVYTRLDYFLTQLSILWIYIGKFFIPYPLRLEYPYQINSFPLWQTVLAGLGHLALISIAVIYRKRVPLILFGIVFYYIAHLVESSLIPIKDIAVEHRTYLPNIGLILALFSGVMLLISNTHNKKFIAFVSILLVVCACLTIHRNQQWLDPVTFYEHELSLYPQSCRILNNLADEYYKLGKNEIAHSLIERCVLNSPEGKNHPEMINNYLSMLVTTKQFKKAEEVGERALKDITDPISKRRILANMGIFKLQLNQLPQAEIYFKEAIKLPSPLSNTFFALSLTLAKQGKLAEAKIHATKGLTMDPNNQRGMKILQKINRLLSPSS